MVPSATEGLFIRKQLTSRKRENVILVQERPDSQPPRHGRSPGGHPRGVAAGALGGPWPGPEGRKPSEAWTALTRSVCHLQFPRPDRVLSLPPPPPSFRSGPELYIVNGRRPWGHSPPQAASSWMGLRHPQQFLHHLPQPPGGFSSRPR